MIVSYTLLPPCQWGGSWTDVSKTNGFFILDKVFDSDHCPIVMEISI